MSFTHISDYGTENMQKKENCYTCYYWNATDEVYMLSPMECGPQQCRRYAPAVGEDEGNGFPPPVWPFTGPYDWCGDYRSKDISFFWLKQNMGMEFPPE